MKYPALLLLFLLSFHFAFSQQHFHTVAKAPLRKTASAKGQVLIVVPKNTEVNAEKVEGNWVYAFYYGRKGYISKKQLKADSSK